MLCMKKTEDKKARYLWIPKDIEPEWDELFVAIKKSLPGVKIGEIGAAAMLSFMRQKRADQLAAIRQLRSFLVELAEGRAAADEAAAARAPVSTPPAESRKHPGRAKAS